MSSSTLSPVPLFSCPVTEADRQFKSKPPKKGIQGIFGDDIPGMEGLGTVSMQCLQSLELHELAQYGII
uniref:Retinal rod rhodopsin-sensitive cGMP 3',5'-cyclic phosphodiesterase subunit gamma n=1 Tax=Labrus bergylta TaxID=56723 RepID=A0A3Q3ERW2_9LABR